MALSLIRNEGSRLEVHIQTLLDRATPLNDSQLISDLREVQDEVRSVLKDSNQPARIGFGGQFSTGKTRLIEALLGCGGMLPVAANATTGNILEILVNKTERTRTEFTGWQVEIIGRDRAASLLARFAAKALLELDREDRTPVITGFTDVRSSLRQIINKEGDSDIRQQRAVEWGNAVRKYAHTTELRLAAAELCRFTRAIQLGQRILGRTFTISAEQAGRLLTLKHDASGMLGAEIGELQPAIPDLDGIEDLSGAFDGDSIRSLFHLVRKVIVTAEVPDLVAETLGIEEGIDFRFVDCPGGGADGTGVRDEELSAEEMKSIDTLLVLTSCVKPGERTGISGDMERLWQATARERIMVVGSRFDEMPIRVDDNDKIFDQLANEEGPLTEQQVLDALRPTLGTVINFARRNVANGDPNRIAMVSSMAWFDERDYELTKIGSDVRFGTEQFLTQQIRAEQPWRRVCEAWGKIARRLTLTDGSGDSRAGLAEMLDAFAADGGIPRLTSRLQLHLRQNAHRLQFERLQHQLETVRPRINELGECVTAAEAAMPGRPAKKREPAVVTDASSALARMAKHLHNLEDYAKAFEFSFEYRKPGSKIMVDLIGQIESEIIDRIHSRNEWRDLLHQIDSEIEPGLLQPWQPTKTATASSPWAKLKAELQSSESVPVKSDDFLEPFLEVMRSVQSTLRDGIDKAVISYLERLNIQLTAIIGADSTPLRNAAKDALIEYSSSQKEHAAVYRQIAAACGDLTSLLPMVSDDVSKLPAFQDESFLVRFFPLQHEGSPMYYAWHAPLHQRWAGQYANTTNGRHFMFVMRLRQILVESGIAWATDILRQAGPTIQFIVPEALESCRMAIGHAGASLD